MMAVLPYRHPTVALTQFLYKGLPNGSEVSMVWIWSIKKILETITGLYNNKLERGSKLVSQREN